MGMGKRSFFGRHYALAVTALIFCALLAAAGLVLDRRVAQWVRYRLNPDLPPDLAPVVQAILAGVRAPARVINAAGVFDLAETAAVIAGARLLLGVDSGPVHLAIGVGAPGVVPCVWSSPRLITM